MKADKSKMAYACKQEGRNSNAWFTPSKYIESARAVLGNIDLDPFSDDHANLVVKAGKYYTVEDNAFRKPWKCGTLWMNPPYSGAECKAAVFKFLAEWNLEHFESGIFLVNNATETQWFQQVLKSCDAVCFTNHRISFWNADGKEISGNTRGQAFFYFGDEPHTFAGEFVKHGVVILGSAII